MTNVFAIIPARSGSKGVPNKNIRILKGHSLLEWSISACKKSKLINEIFVSTDSKKYKELAIRAGAKAPFLRPKEFSGDNSTDFEMIAHFLEWLSNKNKILPEYLVHIRPTTPLREPNIIDKAIEYIVNNPQATALRSVHLMSESAYKTFEITNEGILRQLGSSNSQLDEANKPRQQYPNTYVANGYVDVLKTSYILESSTIHGNLVLPFLTPLTTEVDSEEDFNYLNYLIDQEANIIKKLFD